MKLKFIYDNYHGNIELSDLEFKFLRSPLVHRLHQILQNSTAYLVFPCCKTSRFEHSIGVMDYSSKMFVNGLSNSDVTDKYLDEKTIILKGIASKQKQVFESEIPKLIVGWGDQKKIEIYKKLRLNSNSFSSIIESKEFLNQIIVFLGEDFIDRNVKISINEIKNVDHHYNIATNSTLLLLNQALRLYGLFHDIGHLPFSHLFEFALENAFPKIDELIKKNNSKSFISGFYTDIKTILDASDKNRNTDKIHEIIGKKITTFIFMQLRKKEAERNDCTVEEKLLNLLILRLLEGILDKIREGEKSELYSLYKIVSGTIDSDRLDFIQRDGVNSGISISSGNIDRIIKMFCLCFLSPDSFSDEYNDFYRFLPAIQSIHDVEEVLQDRYKIYKFMVNHHAVKRSDHILQKIIEYSIIKDADVKKSSSKKDPSNFLETNSFISTIRTIKDIITKPANDSNYNEIIYRFFQLTDFWLLSLINKDFNDSLLNTNYDPKVKILLSEIYENSRHYSSLWKRSYEFEELLIDIGKICYSKKDEFIRQRLKKAHDGFVDFNNIKQIIKHLEQLNNSIKRGFCSSCFKVTLDCYKENEENKASAVFSNKTSCKELNPEKNCINEIYYNLGKRLIKYFQALYGEEGWCFQLESLINNNDYNFEVIVAPTRLHDGIKDLRLVDIKNQADIRKIDEVSVVQKSLHMDLSKSISFYAYYKSDKIKESTLPVKIEGAIKKSIVELFVYDVKKVII